MAFIIAIILLFNIKVDDLDIVKDKSYFSDFYVKGEKVYIQCEITIKNSSSVNKAFKLNAIFKDDVELGLLKDENLKGYNQALTNNEFVIAKQSTSSMSVSFVGNFAGINKKHDRNLPEIVITIVE